tara:strand:+ start:1931 stop:3121 length:1191 start_codon:yes stop_codon:yes gene_type:complete
MQQIQKIHSENNNEYSLSRYLYAKDECEIMLVSSILTNKLDEAYYWTSEMYYSGYNIRDLFWKIYYDFYFDFNPKFEIFIRQKQKQGISIETYFHILQNMVIRRHSSRVFIMRQSIEHFIRIKYRTNKYNIRGRKPKYCNNIDKIYQNLIIYIHKKDFQGIVYWLYKLLLIDKCDECVLFINLLRFLIHNVMQLCDTDVNNVYLEHLIVVYNKFLNVNKHKNVPNYLLFISIISNILNNDSNRECPIKLFDKSHCKSIYEHENRCVDRIYNTLKVKRLYSVAQYIGSFDILRNNIDNFQNNILANWEYYTRYTPCWIERFNLFKVSFSECCKIVFENDDLLEEFYDSYGYELDEQSKIIQNQSIETIYKITWKIWYDLHFKEGYCIDFDDDFTFTY